MPGGKTLRHRPLVTVSLSPEALRAADEMADMLGVTRSAYVEMLIRRKAMEEGLTLRKPRKPRKSGSSSGGGGSKRTTAAKGKKKAAATAKRRKTR